jgi:hypothetical protein
MESFVFILSLIAIAVIGFLLYTVLNRPEKVVVNRQVVAPAVIPVQHWGFGYRPYWRRHWWRRGLPGFY